MIPTKNKNRQRKWNEALCTKQWHQKSKQQDDKISTATWIGNEEIDKGNKDDMEMEIKVHTQQIITSKTETKEEKSNRMIKTRKWNTMNRKNMSIS